MLTDETRQTFQPSSSITKLDHILEYQVVHQRNCVPLRRMNEQLTEHYVNNCLSGNLTFSEELSGIRLFVFEQVHLRKYTIEVAPIIVLTSLSYSSAMLSVGDNRIVLTQSDIQHFPSPVANIINSYSLKASPLSGYVAQRYVDVGRSSSGDVLVKDRYGVESLGLFSASTSPTEVQLLTGLMISPIAYER